MIGTKRRDLPLGLALLMAAISVLSFTSSTKAAPVGLDRASYLKLFLVGSELPAMRKTQDSRFKGPDPKDRWFKLYQGRYGGMQIWMGSGRAAVWRVVDIRWVFPSAKHAALYHRAALRQNSERQPVVHGATHVGSDCHVFGGVMRSLGVSVVHFYYIFRVKNVVVKLYVAQGPQAHGLRNRLTTATVASMGQRIVNRINWISRSRPVVVTTMPVLHHRMVGIKYSEYLRLFMTASELLGMNMRLTQDSRNQGADPKDRWFRHCKGLRTGLRVWMGATNAVFWRMVDIRWVFPSAASASLYHRMTLRQNSEKQHRIFNAPKIGLESHAYGEIMRAGGVSVRHFIYLFRVRNVVVKLYAAQGPASRRQLTAPLLSIVAQRIVDLINRVGR